MNANLAYDAADYANILAATQQMSLAYLENIAQQPTSITQPIRHDTTIPQTGLSAQGALATFEQRFAPYMVATSGARYWGFVTGGVTPAALVGDWLTSVYDPNPQSIIGNGDISVIVEIETMRLLRQLFALPETFFGGFVSGATMSNYTGLAVARQWYGATQGVDVAESGLTDLPHLRVLSATPHSCVTKNLSMLGIGRNRFVKIKTLEGREAMDIEDLRRHLDALDGHPCIVSTSGGTVNTVDFDDAAAITALKKTYPFWWHIDAAFGGFAAVSPKHAHLLSGWEQADSIAIDLHKWLNVPYDSAISLVNEKYLTHQRHTFQNTNAAYLGDPKKDFNYLNFLPDNSRRLRALPAWMSLMAYGVDGYRDIVERNVDNAQLLGKLIENSEKFELLAPVRLNVVCFSLKNQSAATVNTYLNTLNETGKVFITPTVYAGRAGMRAAFVNWRTEAEDVKEVFELMEGLIV